MSRVVLKFPDPANWPPGAPCFDFNPTGNFGTWNAPNKIRATDPGVPMGFSIDVACEDNFAGSIDGGFTLVDYSGPGDIPLQWGFTDLVNGPIVEFLVVMNPALPANGQAVLSDSLGGSVNVSPLLVSAGDSYRMLSTWAGGHWTSQLFQDGVLIATLNTLAPVDPTGGKFQVLFDSGSVGGGGQPGAFTDFGDLVVYFTTLGAVNPATPYGIRTQSLGGNMKDESIEGDV